jgi:hypothetical protein
MGVVFDPAKHLHTACRALSVKECGGVDLRKFDHAVVRNLETAVRNERCSGAVD